MDDGVIISRNKREISDLLDDLNKEFKISINQNLQNFLGMELKWEKDYLILNQNEYCRQILGYGMSNAKRADILYEVNDNQKQKTTKESNFPYRQCVGSLLYLSNRIRPDIAHTVNRTNRKVKNNVYKQLIDVFLNTVSFIQYHQQSNHSDTVSFPINLAVSQSLSPSSKYIIRKCFVEI